MDLVWHLMERSKGEAEIVATIICGDSYFAENLEEAQKEILEMIKPFSPDLFVAGPAFNAVVTVLRVELFVRQLKMN